MSKRILIVEDDDNVARTVNELLVAEGWKVSQASTLSEAKKLLEKSIDLVLLDWMLPDGEGVDFAPLVFQLKPDAKVIFLTGRDSVTDTVKGLATGATDYIKKPFAKEELLMRVKVHLGLNHQNATQSQNVFSLANVVVNGSQRTVEVEGQTVNLTKKEFDLLLVFLRGYKKVFTREELLDKVWEYEAFPVTRTVDNHVRQLRKKLNLDFIETVHRVGYRIKSEFHEAIAAGKGSGG